MGPVAVDNETQQNTPSMGGTGEWKKGAVCRAAFFFMLLSQRQRIQPYSPGMEEGITKGIFLFRGMSGHRMVTHFFAERAMNTWDFLLLEGIVSTSIRNFKRGF